MLNKKIYKAILFILAGGTAALSNLVLFYIFLNWFHVWYLLASITSFVLSVFVGFYLQKYITFQNTSKSETKKQAILFFLVSMVNLGINILLMLFFVEILHIDKMLSKVFTLAILACWNFFVYEKFVFNKKTPDQSVL
jgi:putative flippase GtrA